VSIGRVSLSLKGSMYWIYYQYRE